MRGRKLVQGWRALIKCLILAALACTVQIALGETTGLTIEHYPKSPVSSANPFQPRVSDCVRMWPLASSDPAKIELSEKAASTSFYIVYHSQTESLASEVHFNVQIEEIDPQPDQGKCTCAVVMGKSGSLYASSSARIGILCTSKACNNEATLTKQYTIKFSVDNQHMEVALSKTFPKSDSIDTTLKQFSLRNKAISGEISEIIKEGELASLYDVRLMEQFLLNPGKSGNEEYRGKMKEGEAELIIESIFADDRLGKIDAQPEAALALSGGNEKSIFLSTCKGFEAISKEKSKDGGFSNFYEIKNAVVAVTLSLKIPNRAEEAKFQMVYEKTCEVTYYNFNKAAVIAAIVVVVIILCVFIGYCLWLSTKGSDRAARHRRACRVYCPHCCLCCVRYLKLQRAEDVQYTRPFENDSDYEDSQIIVEAETKRSGKIRAIGKGDKTLPLSYSSVPEYYSTKKAYGEQPNEAVSIGGFRNESGIDETGVDDRGLNSSLKMTTFSKQDTSREGKAKPNENKPALTEEQKEERRIKSAKRTAKRKEAEHKAALAVMGGEVGVAHAASLGVRVGKSNPTPNNKEAANEHL